MGYHLLAALKSRCVHLSLLGWLSSLSITSWLYSTVVCASTTRNQQRSDTPAGHEVLWKVPMQLIFPIPSLTDQTSSTPSPFEQSVILERASLKTQLLLNHSFILNPAQTQRVGSFPFLPPYSQDSAYTTCTSLSSLALPWQDCKQPKASQAPEPTQSSNTPSSHHYPPFLIAASLG